MYFKRKSELHVHTSHAAELEAAHLGIGSAQIEILMKVLHRLPLSERDVCDGALRFRQFDQIVVGYALEIGADSHILSVWTIRRFEEPTLTKKVWEALNAIATLRGALTVSTGAPT